MNADQLIDMQEVVEDAKANALISFDDLEALVKLGFECLKLREQQRWIPVSERLPKPYESVLAWVGGGLEILFIETRLDGSNPRWNKTFGSDLTHWMPLPEAPAGEQA